MQRIIYVAFVFVVLGCGAKPRSVSGDAVAQVLGNKLSRSDIENIIKLSKNYSDSTSFVKDYIEDWATDELLYYDAENLYKNDLEINQRVEEYRKTLVLDKYRQHLIEEKSKEPTEEEITDFFNKNREHFILSEPIIKGAILSITKTSANINTLKSSMKKLDYRSVEKIEKHSLKQPLNYTLFTDRWVRLSDIAYLLPKQMIENANDLSINSLYEYRDDIFLYMLSVLDFRAKGTQEPLDMAREEIKFLLKENNSKIFFNNYRKERLIKGQKNGDVVFNYEF